MAAQLRALVLALLTPSAIGATTLKITFTESRGALGECTPGGACDVDGTCCTQGLSLSELHVFAADATELPILSIENTDGYSPSNEPVSKLIDKTYSGSKWLDKGFVAGDYDGSFGHSELLVEVDDSAGAPAGYDFVAGSNPSKRDPVSWTVEAMNNCGGWSELSSVSSHGPTPGRFESYNVEGFVFELADVPTLSSADCEMSSAVRLSFTAVVGGPDTDGIQLGEVRAHPCARARARY